MSDLMHIFKRKNSIELKYDIPCPMLREHEGSERFCLMNCSTPELTLITFDRDSFPLVLTNGEFPHFCLNIVTEKDGFCYCPTKHIKIKIMDEYLSYDEYVDYTELARQVGILSEGNTDCSICLHKLIYQIKNRE